MSVDVQAAQLISMSSQWIEEGFLFKAARFAEVLSVAGYCVKIAEDLAHATVFSFENPLHVVVTEGTGVGVHPAGHFLCYIQSLRAAGQRTPLEMRLRSRSYSRPGTERG